MKHLEENYDIVVVGAGHAGCEAALAGARLGLSTIMFTVSAESIALMPCNPNVGGSSKGHLVRELDALGGEMGKNIDKTFIQSKMLNCSKGPAVHSLRAQADKQAYSNEMRKTLENQENLTIRQGEVTKLLVEDGKITGVRTYSGAIYHCKAVVLCTGTYLKARCIYGDVSNYTGPNGLQAANYLTDSLKELGIEMFRFKTGTPARIAGNTIDYSKMEEQFGDERVVPFSFSTDPEDVQIEQKSCWLTYTNETTHDIIRANLDRSEAYIGVLIDDLVTKENHEPYRMMTSRAEYRLLLRQDNADLRLRKKGWEVGLVDDETYAKVVEKERLIAEEIQRVENTNVGMTEAVQSLLESKGSTPLKSGISLAELIRRPELSYADVAPIDKNRPELAWDVQEQVNINIKYDGYIRRQMKQVEQFKKLEAKKIPEDLDYKKVKSLRIEARQKLELYRPVSIGQASRISGVSPADISVLLVYMEQYGKERR